MAKKFKLYLSVLTSSKGTKKTVLNAENLRSLSGVLDIKGIVDNMVSQSEEIKKGKKEFEPFIQKISMDKFKEIEKEILSKIKVTHKLDKIKLYTEFGINLINLSYE